MQQLLLLLGSFAVVFFAGFYASKIFIGSKFSFRNRKWKPVENARTKMKTGSALYRCRLLSYNDTEWVFSAPFQRDVHVPIPIGADVTCEVVAEGGLLIFQSQVIARRADQKAIVVAAPMKASLEERRQGDRRDDVPMEVVVGGKNGSVMDLSPGGARVRIKGFEREGNIVRIDLPSGESRGATVVDSQNDGIGSTIRLRFDEQITVPSE
ncbi:MAG: flagellar brake domain-containing protein [Armatimonadetes bacterium]|nr:flagellar brake domain-containing protein [Armatimonadota bacterium]